VAPGNPYLGIMLAYTPLHVLLLDEIDFPLVATSGNLGDEPICIDEADALRRLSHIADLFLVHDRPIARHVDDSVMWRVEGEARLLRKARGFAPKPVLLRHDAPSVLAVGAQLKNAIALGVGHRAFVSQHIGDMETPQALGAFERVISDFLELYEAEPVAVAHDLHPDYAATRWARGATEDGAQGPAKRLRGLPCIGVQHHHAHLASCLADNDCEETALGVIWDGTGYGTDGTVWGGEFLLGDAGSFERVAHLRPFRLPGGEAAVREPRRAALALLWELQGEAVLRGDGLASIRAFATREREVLGDMLERDVNCPRTTSVGRLFDGVASLLDLAQRTTFEGQAAMALEFVADDREDGSYPVELRATGTGSAKTLVLDWRPLLGALLEDLANGVEPGRVSARFHSALVEAMVAVAQTVGSPRVALSGGCFQNRRLVERCAARLRGAGLQPLLHRRAPPNDGGISLGQLCVAAARLG
jgi:hydrogenase maturation protein HypF